MASSRRESVQPSVHRRGFRLYTKARPALLTVSLVFLAAIALFPLEASARAGTLSMTPRRGGTLTIVVPELNFINLDPVNPEDFSYWSVGNPVYDSLFVIGRNNKIAPQLATSYRYTNDDKTLTVHVRRGVHFQDGTSLDAQAVVYNLKRYEDPKLADEYLSSFQPVTGIKATGPYTVQLTFNVPYLPMINLLASTPVGMMASPTALQKEGAKFGLHPVGAGPYEFVREVPQSLIVFKRWTGYWQKGLPYLNEVIIQGVGTRTSGFDALQSGTADIMADTLADTQVERQVLKDSQLTVQKISSGFTYQIYFNVKKPPFNNLLARRAVTLATDGSALIKHVENGLFDSSDSPVGPASSAWPGSTVPGYPGYNLNEARRLVKKLGGLSFTLDVDDTPTGVGSVEEGTALKAQWAQAGIDVKLDPIGITELIATAHAKNYQSMFLGQQSSIEPDPALFRNTCGNPLNQTNICNAALDKALVQGREGLTQKARKAAYSRAFRILAQLLPFDDVYSPTGYYAVSKQVHGFEASNTQWLELQRAWLS